MDIESTLVECTILAAELCLFTCVYKLYREKLACLTLLKGAECLEINRELSQKVQNKGGVIPYAVISGNVKALATPLQSQYYHYIQGVIREKIVKEDKVAWIPMLRMWRPVMNNIQQSVSSIPFALCNKSIFPFMKQCVEVVDPLSAEELIIPVIYEDFTPHQNTIGEAVLGFFQGERTVGVHEIENILIENTNLTAVGKLVIENEELKIKPSEMGTYFLTPLTSESLISEIESATKSYKICASILGILSFCSLIYISKKGFLELKRRIDRFKYRRMLDEEKKKRRSTNVASLQDIEHVPKCVICLEKAVEIIILECGHACLCLDCSEQISESRNFCPVCRNRILRLVPVYLP